jgi:hypothetical protein
MFEADTVDFRFIDLPPFVEQTVNGISGDGSTIVGGSNAFYRWRAEVGYDELSEGGSAGWAASADGATIVGREEVPVTLGAAHWTESSGLVALGTGGIANAITPDGSLIVGTGGPTFGPSEAFRWTSSGGVEYLGTLNGSCCSTGTATSNDGSVVLGDSDGEVFRWTSSGMVSLGTISNTLFISAMATSGDGSVVVGTALTNSFVTKGYVWTQSTGIQELGAGTLAHDVTDDGSLVAGVVDGGLGSPQKAAVWDAGNGWRYVQDRLAELGLGHIPPGALVAAKAISSDGCTIAGDGSLDGDDTPWIATFSSAAPVHLPRSALLVLALSLVAALLARHVSRG